MDCFGFTENESNTTKEDIRQVLIGVAKAQGTIYYSELVRRLPTVKLEPHHFALFNMLGEISIDEYEKGRGMLSAVVITVEEGKPGRGFFSLAESLGRAVEDDDVFWIGELNKVHEYWESH